MFAYSVFHAENGQSTGQFYWFSRTQESVVSYKKYMNVLFYVKDSVFYSAFYELVYIVQ